LLALEGVADKLKPEYSGYSITFRNTTGGNSANRLRPSYGFRRIKNGTKQTEDGI